MDWTPAFAGVVPYMTDINTIICILLQPQIDAIPQKVYYVK